MVKAVFQEIVEAGKVQENIDTLQSILQENIASWELIMIAKDRNMMEVNFKNCSFLCKRVANSFCRSDKKSSSSFYSIFQLSVFFCVHYLVNKSTVSFFFLNCISHTHSTMINEVRNYVFRPIKPNY